MSRNSLLLQIFMAGIAIGIVITYIQPTIGTIRKHQDDIAKIKDETETIAGVNSRLAELYQRVSDISQNDKAALLTYLPDKVDDVQVLKDLSFMAEDSGVTVDQLEYGGLDTSESVDEAELKSRPEAHVFNIAFNCSYEQLKRMLAFIESNNYPLLVKSLDVTPTEGGLLSTSLVLITYSHKD